MDLIAFLLPKIEHFRMLGYWVLLLVSLLESMAFVGLAVPGATLVVLMGALSARGYWDLSALIWFATAGAILGDGISYSLGKRGKVLFTEGGRIFRASYLERGEAFFRKHGGKSVFLGRFLGPLRAVIPFVAGISRMDVRQFYLWNCLSAVLWAGSHLLVGYLFGNVWNMVEIWGGRVGFLLAAIVVFLIITYLLERFILTKGKQITACVGSGLRFLLHRVSGIQLLRNVFDKHPRFLDLYRSRLDPGKFSGLPLTLLGIVFLYVFLAFVGVVEDVVNRESIAAIDTRFADLLYVCRSESLVKSFLWITLLGKAKIVLGLAAIATVMFWMWNRTGYILPFWVCLGGSYLTTALGKIILHRQRPPEIGVYDETFYSFPSGHAVISVAFFGFITYVLLRHIGAWRNRLNFCFVAIMLIAAIGFSRLYLGVHFLSDVIGGYLLGMLWLIIGICLTGLSTDRWPPHLRPSFKPQVLRSASAFFILIAVAFYLLTGASYHPDKRATVKQEVPVVVENIVVGFERLKLPRYTESITAHEGTPLNVMILAGNDGSLTASMRKAGWLVPDPISFGSVTRFAATRIQRGSYLAAPIAPAFWNGRANELSFVKPSLTGTPGMRHEARFWKTRLTMPDGSSAYIGLVTRTDGFRWLLIPRTVPDIDRERDGLSHDLHTTHQVVSDNDALFVKPVARQGPGEQDYFTEGLICVITLQ
ncbi:MAG: phosphatase PAP2 family protein [Deltaproteobacteria bacterium]|nr:phosphatase PAP2 family protein [Deltaproteobacteria bacterium]TLN01374.1 MAG: phosphatase PAP2 family protein [bacterium]